MVVYIDVLLFENLIVNCFLLEITAKTLRVNARWFKVIIGGFIGSIYVLTLFSPKTAFANSILIKLIMALVMVCVVFKVKDKFFLLKATAVFIIYSMLLAGICIFLQYSQGNCITGSIIMDFTFKKLFLGIMIFLISINRLVIFIKDRKAIFQLIYPIEIIYNSKHKSLKGFLDTGNELREPITNMPVILVNKDIYKSFSADGFEKYYIPYRIFNGDTGNLEAFKADYINIKVGKDIIKKSALVALSNEILAPGYEYEALLSRGIFL